jgi:hypothetical protein
MSPLEFHLRSTSLFHGAAKQAGGNAERLLSQPKLTSKLCASVKSISGAVKIPIVPAKTLGK